MPSRDLLTSFGRHRQIAVHVANILAGYTLLEAEMARCLGQVVGDFDIAMRALYRTRGEQTRIDVADAFMRPKYAELKLSDTYNETLGAMRHCKAIRNQYAHCYWSTSKDVLSFANFDSAVKSGSGEIEYENRYVSLTLLDTQEEFFVNLIYWYDYLQLEFRRRTDLSIEGPWPSPPRVKRPVLSFSLEEYYAGSAN